LDVVKEKQEKRKHTMRARTVPKPEEVKTKKKKTIIRLFFFSFFFK